MEYLFRVAFARCIIGTGCAIMGSNPEVSSDDIRAWDIVNKDIVIRTSSGAFVFRVVRLEIFWSLMGNPGIGVVVEESEHFGRIDVGASVYRASPGVDARDAFDIQKVESLEGSLHHLAHPELAAQEDTAWERHVVDKHTRP